MRTHLSLEPSPAERGFAFGRVHREVVAVTVEGYRRRLAAVSGPVPDEVRRFGREMRRSARSWASLCDEVAALAEGASQDPDELLALNARTELLGAAGTRECSVIGVGSSHATHNETLLAQNWDWHPDARETLVWWQVVKPDGSWFATLTEAGILAKIGINSDGVGCVLNRLTTDRDGTGRGLPIHFALRLLLQEARDLESATQLVLAQSYDASSAITIGHHKGETGTIQSLELSPVGAVVAFDSTSEPVAHTNHFLAPLEVNDTGLLRWSDSTVRLDDVRSRLRDLSEVSTEGLASILQSHVGAPYGVCSHADDQHVNSADMSTTLASVILNLAQRSVVIALGNPCRTAYVPVPVPS